MVTAGAVLSILVSSTKIGGACPRQARIIKYLGSSNEGS
jgi:hypothetical protein